MDLNSLLSPSQTKTWVLLLVAPPVVGEALLVDVPRTAVCVARVLVGLQGLRD